MIRSNETNSSRKIRFWLGAFAFFLLLGAFRVSDFYANCLAAIAAFVTAFWLFPFVYPSGFLTLLLGAAFVATYFTVGLLFLLLGDPHFLKTWIMYAAIGLGFGAHGCMAMLFGKRPERETEGQPKAAVSTAYDIESEAPDHAIHVQAVPNNSFNATVTCRDENPAPGAAR